MNSSVHSNRPLTALAAVMIAIVLLGSCSAGSAFPVTNVLLVLPGRQEGEIFEFQLLMYHRQSKQSAILRLDPRTRADEVSLSDNARQGPKQLKAAAEELLGLQIETVIEVDPERAGALFAILDSLAVERPDEDLPLNELYTSRWGMLYTHARVLISQEQVADTIYSVTSDYLSEKRVETFMRSAAERPEESKGPYLIGYPIDMNHKPLYDGAYGKELVRDILHSLESNNL